MKLLTTLFVSAGFVLSLNTTYGQYLPAPLDYQELGLLFTNYGVNGSARIQGIGGAQVSLGGDISSAMSNPAGLGFYNRSELSISPSLNFLSTDSRYLGTNTSDNRGRFNIDNFGIVFNKTKGDQMPGAWRGGSFAISLSKLNEFNNNISYRGSNGDYDMIDYYINDANRQVSAPSELFGLAKNAYQSYLISEYVDEFDDGSEEYFYDRTFFREFPDPSYTTEQSEFIQSTGSQSQLNFSYGGNFNDKLYIGVGLGLPFVDYLLAKSYYEEYPNLQYDVVLNSDYYEELKVEGVGINATFGIIARPINQITIGVSLVTPTYYSIQDYYYTSVFSNYSNYDLSDYDDYFNTNYDWIKLPDDTPGYLNTDYTLNESVTINDEFDEDQWEPSRYNITTPMRLKGGASFFFNKNGFISADLEWVNYRNMRLSSRDFSLSEQNTDIKDLYKSTLNYSLGAEYRINSLRFRAGYAFKADPYYQKQDVGRDIQNITFGIGYRNESFFLDLAAVNSSFKSVYIPYTLYDLDSGEPFYQEPVTIDNNNLNIVISAGLFF